MARPGVQPGRCVFRRDAAADLEAVWVSGQRGSRGDLTAGAKHDDMAAAQPVGLVQGGEVGGGTRRDVVRDGARPGVGQCSADNLNDAAILEVNAGTEGH